MSKHKTAYKDYYDDEEPLLHYGNWCGENWTAGQVKPAKDLTKEDYNVPAVDNLDQCCKTHDINIAVAKTAEDLRTADEQFIKDAKSQGVSGKIMSALVNRYGPSTSLLKMPRDGRLPVKYNNPSQKRRKKDQEKQRLRNEENRQKAILDSRRLFNPDDIPLEEGFHQQDFNTPSVKIPTESNISPQQNDLPEPKSKRNLRTEFDEELPPLPDDDDEDLENEDEDLQNDFDWEGVTQRASLINSRQNTKMENEQDVQMESTQRSGGQITRAGNRETPVNYNYRPEMGIFTETRTAYLPITFYLSINRTQITESIPLHFRVDWPFDILKRNTLAAQELDHIYTNHVIRAQGLSNDLVKQRTRSGTSTGITASAANYNLLRTQASDVATNVGQIFPFPTTIVGNTAAVQAAAGPPAVKGKTSSGTISDSNCVPAYRKWYARMYDYAHCMETDWKVTYFSGDYNEPSQNVTVFEGLDCQSAGNTETIPTDQEFGAVQHWPYLKKHELKTKTVENKNFQYSITGKWTPNMQFPMKMVANEEDIKTWTKLDVNDFLDRNPNTYRNDVTLLHYSSPDSNAQAGFYNVRVDIRYKIQFKDLKTKLRWLNYADTPISLSSQHCIQFPAPDNTIGVLGQPERVYAVDVIPR